MRRDSGRKDRLPTPEAQRDRRGDSPVRLQDFAGLWHIERRIEDRLLDRVGQLTGTGTFAPDGPGLRYTESGILNWPGQPPLQARQTYLWRMDGQGDGQRDGQGIAVAFADGRPFHRFSGDTPVAAHWCDPDQYDVTYDFTGWPDWSSRWQVSGPRKDYTATTFYTRRGSD